MKFYRYEDHSYYGGRVKIEEREFLLVKETPKGYWIAPKYYFYDYTVTNETPVFLGNKKDKKWISKNAYNSYAYKNKEKAMQNFIGRKRAQIHILENKLLQAKLAYQKALMKNDVSKLKDTPEFFLSQEDVNL